MMSHSKRYSPESDHGARVQHAASCRDRISDIARLLAQCDRQPRAASFTLGRRGVHDADFVVSDQDTIFVFYPRSAVAQGWWRDNVEPDALNYGRNFVVERRFVQDILDGLRRDGFAMTSAGGQHA